MMIAIIILGVIVAWLFASAIIDDVQIRKLKQRVEKLESGKR